MTNTPSSLLAMARHPRWVAYSGKITANNKIDKVPINPRTGRNASNNSSKTWARKSEADRFAKGASKKNARPGIGIVLGKLEPELSLIGVDLDGCVDPQTEDVEDWAVEVVKRLGAYAELSPSGTGLKVFFLHRSEVNPCDLIDGKKKKEWKQGSHFGIELHVENSYFTVTGDAYDPEHGVDKLTGLVGPLVEVSQSQLEWLIGYANRLFAKAGGKAKDESGSGYGFRFLQNLAREGVLEKCDAIERLQSDEGIAGDWGRRASNRELGRSWARACQSVKDQVAAILSDLDNQYQDVSWDSEDPIVAELNEKHAVVRNGGRILVTWFDDRGGNEFGSVEDVHKWYANRMMPVPNSNRWHPISKYWLSHADRRQYNRVVFCPDETRVGPDELNLWSGWAIPPSTENSTKLILRHIFEVLANGNQEYCNYIVAWLAHMIQRPAEKPGVALVFKGGKGAGKDTLAVMMRMIVGNNHTAHINRPDLLTQKFNAHFEKALFAHVEEAFWAGSKQDKGTLQALITSETTTLERKGIDPITIESFVRLLMTTNEDWVVPASADERRYAVFNVSNARIGDRNYFDALYEEMRKGGAGAFLNYLQRYDLSDFEVREVPQTGALIEQKLATLSGLERWWYDVLSDGILPGAAYDESNWDNAKVSVERSALRSCYDDYMRNTRFQGESVTSESFGVKLRELVPSLQDTRPTILGARLRLYVFPPLHEARRAFEKMMGGNISWDDESQVVQDVPVEMDDDIELDAAAQSLI